MQLEVPFKFPYTECMKNKNVTITELVNLLKEQAALEYGESSKYAGALGALSGILDYHIYRMPELQKLINESYERNNESFQELKLKNLQKTCNEASLEELYA